MSVDLLWHKLFYDPHQWWDNRRDKRSPRHPDFRHKATKELLWLNNPSNPAWVESQLAILDSEIQIVDGGPHGFAFPCTSGDERSQISCGIASDIERLCKEGQLEKAMDALVLVDQQGRPPSPFIYKKLLQACMRKKSLGVARRVHAHLENRGLEANAFLSELVVTTLVNCGGLADGLQLFRRLSHKTAFSWTAIISGYSNAGQYRQALSSYKQMQLEGVQPDKYTIVSLLKTCSMLRDLEEGKCIHSDVQRLGFQSDVVVGSILVTMYAKSGSIIEAQRVFDSLPRHDPVLWNAMLAAYAQHGQGDRILQLYGQMHEEGVRPDARTFVSALQACGILAEKEEGGLENGQNVKVVSLRMGRKLHAEAVQMGFGSDVFVGNTSVTVFAKCGSIDDARRVFDTLVQRDVVSWNALIAAYAHQNLGDEALNIYAEMQKEGVRPDARTLVGALQACGTIAEQEDSGHLYGHNVKLNSLQQGKELHAEAARLGCGTDVFVCSALVSVYTKCGSNKDAKLVFDRLSHRDVVSWTAMIGGYIQRGEGEKALELYALMQEEGVSPDAWIFASAVQACSILVEKVETGDFYGQQVRLNPLQKGKEVHAAAARRGLDSDVYVGNTLISMYARCGSIKDAEHVFCKLSQPNIVSWNAMLAGYAQQGEGEKALQLYSRIQEDGVRLNARTLVSALDACGTLAELEDGRLLHGQNIKMESLQKGKRIYADAIQLGYGSDTFVYCALISMYLRCGSILDAQQVFDTLSEPDIMVWNAMLTAYAQHGQGETALQIYRQMQEKGIEPDDRTFVSALQACSTLAEKEECSVARGQHVKAESLRKGRELHSEAARLGYEADMFVGSALVSMYAKCGSVQNARHVFDGLFRRDAVSWTAIIGGYAKQDQGEKALQMFAEMQLEGLQVEKSTFICVLEACSNTGALDRCRQIHAQIVETGFQCSHLVVNSLIHAYGRCGSMVDAQHVFQSLSNPNVVSWTALIAGHARQGDCETSIQLYEAMLLAGVTPDEVTFLAVLSACSHAGMVDRGLAYFDSMNRVHGISPQVEHFACVIDLVGRAGLLCKAEDLVSRMPMQPKLPVWMSFLGACRKHGDVLMARRAFDGAVGVEPKEAAAYVLMSNVYANAGMWSHARGIDELRKRADALKNPGQSWIEHGDEVHTFVVGDRSHSETASLYAVLNKLNLTLQGV